MTRVTIGWGLAAGASALTALLLTSVGSAQGGRAPTPATVPSAPLPKTDARARLTVPEMLNAKPIPAPKKDEREARLPEATAAQVQTFNLQTGRAGTEPFTPPRAAPKEALNAGSQGSHKEAATEPRTAAKTVFGTDDRIRITPTTSYPWRTHCKVWMRFPSGNWFMGSGTLIGNKYVITAGHCVHDKSQGGWATQVYVVPGYDDGYMPYGGYYATLLRTWTGWTNYQNFDWDIALVTLTNTVGNTTGWLGYGYWPILTGVNSHLVGYPGMLDGGRTMRYAYGPIAGEWFHQFFYRVDASPGNSGGGHYRIINGNRYVMGVCSWENPYVNGSCRINSTKFDWLKASIASGV